MSKILNVMEVLYEKVRGLSNLTNSEQQELIGLLDRMKSQKINILITGGTGTGKSSTINALFKNKVAKVGTTLKAQTMETEKYEIDNLTIWDSPGLGESDEADKIHSQKIIELLKKKEPFNNKLLIDLVLVIIDGSARQFKPTYELINEVLIPNIEKERIVIAVNKIDKIDTVDEAWDKVNNKPTKELQDYLEQVIIPEIKENILTKTGVKIEPIYFKAGATITRTGEQKPGYNMSKLLYYLLKAIPSQKRIAIMSNINQDNKIWESNDQKIDYNSSITDSILETVGNIIISAVPVIAEKLFGGIGKVASSIFKLFAK